MYNAYVRCKYWLKVVESLDMRESVLKKVYIPVFIVLIAAALIFSFKDTAYAGSGYDFTVLYSEGNTWTLKSGDEILDSRSGEWVGNVDNAFSDIIDIKTGGGPYDLEFVFPDDTEAFVADSEGAPSDVSGIRYTEQADSPLFFSVTNTGIIGGILTTGVEYKTASDTDYTVLNSPQSLIRFGQNVPSGEYEIRAFASESFSYKDIDYVIRRYSPSVFSIKVKPNPNPPIRELTAEDKTITYGESLNSVAERLGNYLGKYVPSDDGDLIPEVTGLLQTYKFDYIPLNPNYDTLEDVEIEFSVVSRRIAVSIDNVQIICGENNIDLSTYPLSYYIRTPLVSGDTEDDLNMSFYFSDPFGAELAEIDTSVPGAYLIKARTDNINYFITSVNMHQNAYSGGRYFVFPTAIKYEIDGTTFTVNRVEGFENVKPKFFKLDDTMRDALSGFDYKYDKEKKIIKGVYVLAFEEQSNFTYVPYVEDFYVSLTPSGSGRYIAYFKDGQYKESDFTDTIQLVYENGTGAGRYIYFVILEDNIEYISGYMWYHTLLIVLSSLVAAGCITMAVIFIKKRWIL